MNSATEHRTCPNCGATIPANAPQGVCPKCLMAAAAVSTEDGQTGGKRPEAPSLERLAAAFPQLEVIEFIGQGGMGAVYKARQKQLDRIVALKVLPPGTGSDPSFAERFTREAKALAKLLHPNIVALFEFGQADGIYYLLMEFVDGVSLGQLLRASRVSAREALAIVPQICDALQYAHDQGIVHRDIKPENILLDRRGRVKVADFGLAKLVESNAPLTRSLSLSDGERVAARPAEGKTPALTDAGRVMGTPAYMAPEQVEHPADVDHRADIYALGVVFYQMLTGELPGKRMEPPSRKVQIDVRLDEVVMRALEKKPELRYQQVSEVKTMVETIVGTPDPSTGGSEGAEPDTGGRAADAEKQGESRVTPAAVRSSRRPWSLIVVAGLFVLTGCSAAWDIGSGFHNHIYSFNFGLLALSVGIGLLRLRHGWRVAALFMVWLPFILGACLGIAALFGHFTMLSHARFFGYELTGLSRLVAMIVACTLISILLGWMSWVLTRSEVKALFQRAGPDRPWIEWAALPVAILIGFVLSILVEPWNSAQSSGADPFAEDSDTAGFGPVVERTLPLSDLGYSWSLDLDSDLITRMPARLTQTDWSSGMTLPKGIIVIAPNTDQPLRVAGTGTRVVPLLDGARAWETLRPSEATVPEKPESGQTVTVTGERRVLPLTFAFKTGRGVCGLLQITGFTENPRAVKIRYKLVGPHAAASPALPTPPAGASAYIFGPAITQVIQSGETGTNLFLDLDTGQLLTPPKAIRALFNESYTKRNSWELVSDPRAGKMREWLRSSGANLMLSDSLREAERLEIREAAALAPTVISNNVVVPFGFDQADANYLATRIKPMLASFEEQIKRMKTILRLQPSFDARLNTRRDSFCFRTHEETVGIFQILNSEDNPHGLRIRYKLVLPQSADLSAQPAHEVHANTNTAGFGPVKEVSAATARKGDIEARLSCIGTVESSNSVFFAIPQDYCQAVIRKFDTHQALAVEADNRQGERFGRGLLVGVDNRIDPETATLKCRATLIPEGENLMVPGLFLNIHLLLEVKHGVILVPADAILRDPQGAFVWAIKPDQTVSVRHVQAGTTDGAKVEIQSGLSPGDLVVCPAIINLRDGEKIRCKLVPPQRDDSK